MRLNKDKRIGRVLFIVEGSRTEFTLLRRIFHDLLGYRYLEKRRNSPDYFKSENDSFSRVAVINTQESNIRYIDDEQYLDEIFDVLRDQYRFPVDQSAVYYLFDRDPRSNKNPALIEKYIRTLHDPYGSDADDYYSGQLLLSYPSIESYTISNFKENVSSLRFKLGQDAKAYISANTEIQIHNISKETLLNAAREFFTYLKNEDIAFDIDEFSDASYKVFSKQEEEYLSGEGFKAFSMLTLALLQMGIIEI